MPSLVKFSLESDAVVLLVFSDGTTIRSSVQNLPQHLSRQETQEIRRAFGLRRHYIKKVLPPWAKVSIVTASAAALAWQAPVVAQLTKRLMQPLTHIPAAEASPVAAAKTDRPAENGQPAQPQLTESAPQEVVVPGNNTSNQSARSLEVGRQRTRLPKVLNQWRKVRNLL